MTSPKESRESRGLLPRFTLKDGNTFLLADALGDIQGHDDGIFTDDTRVLSRFELSIADRPPSFLGAAINQNNTLFIAHLTNLPLPAPGERSIPHGVIHIERKRILWNNRLREQLTITNFSEYDAQVPLRFRFAADFADIFEVQGHQRQQRGTTLPAQVDESSVTLSYQGLDGRVRSTVIEFSILPQSISEDDATFCVDLPSGASAAAFLEIGMPEPDRPSSRKFTTSVASLSASMQERLQQGASVATSTRLFNNWIDRSRSDLALLTTMLPSGPYPFAGIPWFATQFGRDAIITSLQTLWANPSLAAGVLRFLASTQAREESAFRDSQPGKIMHESRRGEMAALQEVPYGCYYGGVDTTPLFVILAAAYESRTGDSTLVDEIWSALIAATQWIEQRLDRSPTGFLDYERGAESGLVNQSWKDSHDSIFHADGRFPRHPVAVVEVQGYAYAALKAMSDLAAARRDDERHRAWRQRADRLCRAINDRFWLPEMNFYAIAIDGDGEPCAVRASNPGHLLFCGVPDQERAAAVTQQLMSDRFYSGWGIRTVAEGQARYNPMSYHNGSIWPHDTALCAAGIARYGGRTDVTRMLNDMFETANHFGMRLPELYCGFSRITGQGPAPYPVACLPQAWSSGSVYMLLQASLGLAIDGMRNEVHVVRPTLPNGIDSLTIRDLPVNGRSVDLEFHRIGRDVVVVRHAQNGVRVLTHL